MSEEYSNFYYVRVPYGEKKESLTDEEMIIDRLEDDYESLLFEQIPYNERPSIMPVLEDTEFSDELTKLDDAETSMYMGEDLEAPLYTVLGQESIFLLSRDEEALRKNVYHTYLEESSNLS